MKKDSFRDRSAANQKRRRLGLPRDKSRGRWSRSVGPAQGDAGCVAVVGELAVVWEFKCGSESGCGGESNAEILCCGAASSCGYGCCSGCGFCCGYESVTARSSGCAGRPPLRGCKLSRPRKHITDRLLTQNRVMLTNAGSTYRLRDLKQNVSSPLFLPNVNTLPSLPSNHRTG